MDWHGLFSAIAHFSKDKIDMGSLKGNNPTTFQGWDELSHPSVIA